MLFIDLIPFVETDSKQLLSRLSPDNAENEELLKAIEDYLAKQLKLLNPKMILVANAMVARFVNKLPIYKHTNPFNGKISNIPTLYLE